MPVKKAAAKKTTARRRRAPAKVSAKQNEKRETHTPMREPITAERARNDNTEARYPKYPGRLMVYTEPHLMEGEAVREYQEQLNKGFGEDVVDVDGIYGQQTYLVTRMVQDEHDLRFDGVVGHETWDTVFAL